MTQLFGESAQERRERTRARYARESTAGAVADAHVNREAVRKFKRIQRDAPELAGEIAAGKITIGNAYWKVVGDDRVPLYLKLEAGTDAALREAADEAGCSRQDIVYDLIQSWLYD